MNAVANIFDTNNDGFIDYYEFISALHPSRDPYRKTLDADQINEEVGAEFAQSLRSVGYLLPFIILFLILCIGESTGVTL